MPELFKHERKTRIIGIPALGIILAIIYSLGGERMDIQTFIQVALTNIFITFLYWQGNVTIFNQIRNKYQDNLTKRLLLTLPASLCYNAAVAFFIIILVYVYHEVPLSFKIFWYNFLPGMTFTLIIGATYEIIYYFNKWKESLLESEKLRRDSINAEYETLKNQVNPHFLFNSMNALSSLVHSDPDKAEKFIDEFSKIYRYVLDKKDEAVVTLSEELDFVKSFLFLQEIRFGKSLQVEINIPGELLNLFLPPVSLQLLVENAIKHNIVTAEIPLQISIFSEGKMIVVKNNLQMRKEPVNSTGVGIKNLKAKYRIISDQTPEFLVDAHHYTARLPLLKEE